MHHIMRRLPFELIGSLEHARRARCPLGRSSCSISTEGPHYHQLYTSLLLPLLQRCSYFYLPNSAYQKIGIWRIHEPTDSISRPHPSLIARKGRKILAVERIGVSGAYHIFGTYRIFASFHVSNFLLQHTFERSMSW
jgi:hypothetical protein